MEHNILELNSPYYWVLILLIIAGGLSYMLYPKKSKWSITLKLSLSFLRFAVLFVVLFFLLDPVIQSTSNLLVAPNIVIAVDDSRSVALGMDSLELEALQTKVQTLTEQLQEKNLAVDVRYLSGRKDAPFDYHISDLSAFLKQIDLDYEGRNLQRTVLVSDGIFNAGISPEFLRFSFPLDVWAVGDTIPKTDFTLQAVKANKIVYQGNQFPVTASILAEGMKGKTAELKVFENNNLIISKKINITEHTALVEETLLLSSDEKGLRKFLVKLEYNGTEFSKENNTETIFVDVIEGKEKILIIAKAPHPDIQAIRQSIERKENYEVEVFIDNNNQSLPTEAYDLIIAHHVSNGSNNLKQFIEKNNTLGIPTWFICSVNSNYNWINQQSNTVQPQIINNNIDLVSAHFNPEFSKFKLSNNFKSVINKLPLLSVPFAEYNVNSNTDVLLYQQIGSVKTSKPLLLINSHSNKKNAVLITDGLWLWRLQEFALNENSKGTDELIQKMVQYLSSKDDKRKFKFYPIKSVFNTKEKPEFDSELYNDLYEEIHDKEIEFSIRSEKGTEQSFAYINTQSKSSYSISALEEGIYSYSGQVIGAQEKPVNGQFIVKKFDPEALASKADYNLLRRLSKNNLGAFFTSEEYDFYENQLLSGQYPVQIKSEVGYDNLINLKWIFYLIMMCITIEWFVRKYYGQY